MIPGSANALLLATAAPTGYNISRSLRFNSADSAHLSRTPASAGNRTTWTWAGWVKRSKLGGFSPLFSAGAASSADTLIYFDSGSVGAQDSINWFDRTNPTKFAVRITTQVFRDISAWYHLVFVWDTNNGTAADRMRLYVNGVRVSAFASTTDPSSGASSALNNNVAHPIGSDSPATGYFDGYLADVYFIDGQALGPTSFGEFSATTGVWMPKAYSGGSYGTNGFHLDFADNSTTAALGTDTSGNGNNWTVNNIQATATGPIYSSTLTGSSTVITPHYGFYSGSPSAPDNSQTSSPRAYVNHPGGTSWIQFNPSPAISGSSLRVFTYQPQGTSGADTWINVNGGSDLRPWRVSPNYTGWSNAVSIPGGSLTSLRVSLSYSGVSTISILAVEVDGVILRETLGDEVDSLVDVPTNGTETDTGVGGEVRGNYCTWNPLEKAANATLSNGNLDITQASGDQNTGGTIAVSVGKWYWEVTFASGTESRIGAIKQQFVKTDSPFSTFLGGGANGYSYANGGYKSNGNNNSATGYSTYTTNDVISVALDLDNGRIFFAKNGTWQESGNPATGSNPAYTGLSGAFTPAVYTPNATLNANFGQRPFAYTAPSGFKALCTANLPAPVVTKPSEVMGVKLYSGTGSSQSVSGVGFSPDWVWIKRRDAARSHMIFDIVRGLPGRLASNETSAENTDANNLTSFDSDGFTTSTGDAVNGSGGSYVAWCWDAGSSTVTLNPGDPGAGSITSQVRANASAGFSIVTYTGNGTSGATIGHGLGIAPSLILVKCRSNAAGWLVYSLSIGNTKYLALEGTAAASTYSGAWNDTSPTSTVFSVGNDNSVNASSRTYVAYCFAPVAGYSSFGSYTGNGSTDGPFVYTGMRVRWVMCKRSDSTGNWVLVDTARKTYNVVDTNLYPNASNAEDNAFQIDSLSNGFKIRSSGTDGNASGGTYIYAAFAESPFNYARAR